MTQVVGSEKETAARPASVTSDGGESVLKRAARILNSFRDEDLVLNLGQLAERSGLPKSTVHRLAEQLHDLGWLEREAGGYRVGIRLFEIGGLVGRRSRLRDIAVPHLQELSRTTGLAVQLGILDGAEVVYLERVLVRGFKLPTRDGGRMPAHCTALGKVMLAFGPDANVETVLGLGLEPKTSRTIVDQESFLVELEQIRRAGIARDIEESVRGIECAAAPVRGSGIAVGAVSVTGPTPGFDLELAAAGARKAAAGIWRDMFGSAYAT